MYDSPSILIISEKAEFESIDDDKDERYGKYIQTFSKIEATNSDFRLLIVPPEAGALKGRHADLVLLEADVDDEFYDRYVKTRVQRKKGAVIEIEV